MLVMKSADWTLALPRGVLSLPEGAFTTCHLATCQLALTLTLTLVAKPILLVCISLADIGVTLYQKVGYHLSLHFSFHFLSLFSSIPFPFPLPPLPLPPFVFFPLLSFPFSLPIPSNPARGLGSAVNDACAGWSRHNAAAAASHIVTSRQSVI